MKDLLSYFRKFRVIRYSPVSNENNGSNGFGFGFGGSFRSREDSRSRASSGGCDNEGLSLRNGCQDQGNRAEDDVEDRSQRYERGSKRQGNHYYQSCSDDSTTSRSRFNSYADQWQAPTNIITLGLIGMLTISSGLLIWFIDPYQMIFNIKCKFSEGGEIFEMWRKPEIDLYLRVFLFNVTNRDAFMAGAEDLQVEQVGPYVYKEIMVHDNVKFNSNGTLSTEPKHPLVWEPELSDGHLETDRLILPNIALLSITHVMSKSSLIPRTGLNFLIKQTNSKPLVEMSAREFMFGYQSSLVTLGNKFMPNWISFEKLGLIDRMYDFEGDYETVFTGQENLQWTGLIDTYRGSKDLPQWKNGSECANVHLASDGTKFPSFIQDNDTLYFYRKSMCRGAKLVRESNQVYNVKSISGYQYKFATNAMDNGFFDPNNKCFCRHDKCLPYGLLDVTDCYYGFPIALSYPHFLNCDNILNEKVKGLSPSEEEHESYFIINSETGMPLDLAVRMQINMALGNLDSMANVGRFSNLVIPLLWTENRMYSLPERLDKRFSLYLNVLPVVSDMFIYFLLVLGCCFVIAAMLRLCHVKEKWQNAKTNMIRSWEHRHSYLISRFGEKNSSSTSNLGSSSSSSQTFFNANFVGFRRSSNVSKSNDSSQSIADQFEKSNSIDNAAFCSIEN